MLPSCWIRCSVLCVVDWMSVGFSHASEKFSLYVFFGKVVASHRSELSVAMGSLPPDTLCAYCGTVNDKASGNILNFVGHSLGR